MIKATIRNLRQADRASFEEFSRYLQSIDPTKARFILYAMVGSPQGAKVLSLFCRDALCIHAFPIDRHVRRKLAAAELPSNEDALVKLCRVANYDPRLVATSFVVAQNPDWS